MTLDMKASQLSQYSYCQCLGDKKEKSVLLFLCLFVLIRVRLCVCVCMFLLMPMCIQHGSSAILFHVALAQAFQEQECLDDIISQLPPSGKCYQP